MMDQEPLLLGPLIFWRCLLQGLEGPTYDLFIIA